MASFDEVRTHHVLEAIADHDRVGRDAFLAAHGFGPARDYVLVHDGQSYDSKAIVGVAHLKATGRRIGPSDFSGGKDGAARVLRDLGFDVRGPERDLWASAASVGSEHARATWALAARERLIEAATTYHSVVTYKELSEFVQRRSEIRTDQLMHYWIGDVLGRVSAECARRGEPMLSALCVDAEGHVGKGYAVAVAEYRHEEVADADDHAAHERLACHVHFGAALPPGGGVPALTPQVRSRRERVTRRKVRPETPARLCPVHFIALPASGVCDLCD